MPRINHIPKESDMESPSHQPGIYSFVVESAELDTYNDKDRIRLRLKTQAEDHGGFTVFDDLYLTEAAMFRYWQFAKSIGMGDKAKDGELDTDDLPGKTGSARLAKDDYSGYLKPQAYLEKENDSQETQQDNVPF